MHTQKKLEGHALYYELEFWFSPSPIGTRVYVCLGSFYLSSLQYSIDPLNSTYEATESPRSPCFTTLILDNPRYLKRTKQRHFNLFDLFFCKPPCTPQLGILSLSIPFFFALSSYSLRGQLQENVQALRPPLFFQGLENITGICSKHFVFFLDILGLSKQSDVQTVVLLFLTREIGGLPKSCRYLEATFIVLAFAICIFLEPGI